MPGNQVPRRVNQQAPGWAKSDPLMAAFNVPFAQLKRRPSDKAALFQEPHTVDGYCNALWRFTCAYLSLPKTPSELA
jgi:hypothetical protein